MSSGSFKFGSGRSCAMGGQEVPGNHGLRREVLCPAYLGRGPHVRKGACRRDLEAGERKALMAVARGERAADLILRGGVVCNVYSRETYAADLVVADGRIAYVGDASGFSAAEELDLADAYVAPGLVEPHGHPWILYNPRSYAQALLVRGVTAAACDDLPLRPAFRERLPEALRAIRRLPLHYYWLTRVGFYGPDEDTDQPGERILPQSAIASALDTDGMLGIAELNRWLNVLPGPDDIVDAFSLARQRGRIVQGHTSGARAGDLNLLSLAGIDSCHEAISVDEARTRLRLGLYTMLRHSSLRADLPTLKGLLLEDIDLSRVMLTTDGSSPAHITREGHLDGMLRQLVEGGVEPLRAMQLATINPATYLGLQGEVGGLAPGRRADVTVYRDLKNFRPELVVAGGRVVARDGELVTEIPPIAWPRPAAEHPYHPGPVAAAELVLPYDGPTPSISFFDSVLTRKELIELPELDGTYDLSSRADLLHAALVARDGRFISRGIVAGLMRDLEGFATSYLLNGHLLVLGRNPESMAQALVEISERDGGFLHVAEGRVEWHLPLPLFGIMRGGSFQDAVEGSQELERFTQAHGYRFADPAYSLHFLVGDFLPGPRLTARGLVDAKSGKVIIPALRRDGPSLGHRAL